MAEGLRRQIERNEYAAGRFLPTERELQLQYGASRATIRKAIGQIVEEGYAQSVPNRGVIALRPVRKPTTNRIALFEIGNFVTRALTVRMGEMLDARGFQLDHPVCTPQMEIEDLLQRALDAGYAGAIIWPFRGFPNAADLARISARLPIVTLDHPLPGATADRVTFDHFEAGYTATAHLIRQGCRKLAVTGILDMTSAVHDRFSGYMKAQFDHGLQPESRLFAFSKTSGMPQHDPTLLHALLSREDRPDGIVILQDETAPTVVSTALKLGLKVPGDLKLVALSDDVDVTVDGVGLSAIAQDWDALCLRACELLLQRVTDPLRPPTVEMLPQHLVIRGLCGSPESEWNRQPNPITDLYGDPRFVRHRYQYSSLGGTS